MENHLIDSSQIVTNEDLASLLRELGFVSRECTRDVEIVLSPDPRLEQRRGKPIRILSGIDNNMPGAGAIVAGPSAFYIYYYDDYEDEFFMEEMVASPVPLATLRERILRMMMFTTKDLLERAEKRAEEQWKLWEEYRRKKGIPW